MTPKPMSPYYLRRWANDLRLFPVASALRQIDIHVARGDLDDRDAASLRALVSDTRFWLF